MGSYQSAHGIGSPDSHHPVKCTLRSWSRLNCYLLFTITLFSSCKSFQGTNNSNISEEYDSLNIDVAKEYYSNGHLKRKTSLKNGELDGVEVAYYPNGQIRYTGFFKKDLQDSLWVWFYNNGDTEQVDNWMNGKNFGDHNEYYKGGSIRKYAFYTLGG